MQSPTHIEKSERAQFEVGLLLDALHWRSGTDVHACRSAQHLSLIESLCQELAVPTITALVERVLHDDAAMARILYVLTAATLTAPSAGKLVVRLPGTSDAPSNPPAQPIPTTQSMPDTSAHAEDLLIKNWRARVIPLLRSVPFPAVWVHDCNDVALLVHLVAMLTDCGLLKRSTIFVTCAASEQVEPLRCALQRALPPCEDADGGSIIVAEFNVYTDSTFNEFDFILCGTTLCKLARPVQQRVKRLLGESLAPCGVLQLLTFNTADAANIAPVFLPMADGPHLYRHAMLERYAQRRLHGKTSSVRDFPLSV